MNEEAEMSRLLMFSSDCHAGLPTDRYAEYFEANYQDELADFVNSPKRLAAMRAALKPGELRAESRERDLDVRSVYASELDQRIPALEKDGFVGEVIFPGAGLGGPNNVIPFSEHFGGPGEFDLQL